MLKRVLKFLSASTLLVALLLAVVINFSETETRYECRGTITREDTAREITAYIKLKEYRWWVGLWSDSHGNLWLEIPNEFVVNFGNIRENGDQLQILDYTGKLEGIYSRLSGTLALNSVGGFIDGKCVRIEKR